MLTMKAFNFLAGIIILSFFSSSWAEKSTKKTFHGQKVFRLYPSNDMQRDFIAELHHTGLDFWSHLFKNQPVDVRIVNDEVSTFSRLMNASQIPYEIIIGDVQKLIDRVEGNLHAGTREEDIVGTYAAYSDVLKWAQGMCVKYSSLAQCGYYGKSTEDRDLLYMKLGNNEQGPNSAIFLEAGMHAREWINSATTIYVVNRLLTTYQSDPDAKRMLDTYNFYVTLISNPDGYEFSRNSDRMWRKTRSKHTSLPCYGVDANRNYDIDWAGTGSSYSPCSDIYHGPKAFSEPETKAMSDLILEHKSELLGFFAIHSYSQLWLIPYGYTSGVYPEDYDDLLRVGEIGGKAIMAVNDRRWQIGNSADILYACSGASDDWSKIKAGVKYSYTLELRPHSSSLNGFIVGADEIEPSGREIFAGLVAAIDAMKKP